MPQCADISPSFPSHCPDTPYTEKIKIFFRRQCAYANFCPDTLKFTLINIYKIKLLTIKRYGKPHLYFDFTTEL